MLHILDLSQVYRFFIDWAGQNYIEVIGALLGVIYVILAIRVNIWCWVAGILNVLFYIYIFLRAKLYGDMALQVFYLGMSFYGLYSWWHGTDKKELAITRIKTRVFFVILILTPVLTLFFGYLLDNYTDSPIPYWDGLTTALGLIGTWMTARKLLENWILWVFANLLCVGIYFFRGLYPTMVFYFILLVMAVVGYIKWRKELVLQQLP